VRPSDVHDASRAVPLPESMRHATVRTDLCDDRLWLCT
jgi:hypothetical protein